MSPNLDDYVPVAERVEAFRRDHPTRGLEADIIVDDGKRILMRAVVTDETGRTLAVGHAEEIRGSSNVNRTSALENCETSAWGRALAALGYEVKRGIASREEMTRVRPTDPVPLQRDVPSEVVARHPSAQTPRNLGLPERIALRARKAGLDDDKRHDVLQAAVGVRSSKEVTAAMTERVFDALDGLAQGELELRYTPDGQPQLWKVHKARSPR